MQKNKYLIKKFHSKMAKKWKVVKKLKQVLFQKKYDSRIKIDMENANMKNKIMSSFLELRLVRVSLIRTFKTSKQKQKYKIIIASRGFDFFCDEII